MEEIISVSNTTGAFGLRISELKALHRGWPRKPHEDGPNSEIGKAQDTHMTATTPDLMTPRPEHDLFASMALLADANAGEPMM